MRSLMIIPYLLLNCCQSHNQEMCQIPFKGDLLCGNCISLNSVFVYVLVCVKYLEI